MSADGTSVNAPENEAPKPIEKSTRKIHRLNMLFNSFNAFSEKIAHANKTGEPIGPVTGFPKMDAELCGALYPGLHVISGNTGAGKTALALQIACQCGCPALYVTCEMSPLELFRRIAARVTETPLHKFKNPKCCISAAAMSAAAHKGESAAPNLAIADATLSYWDRQTILQEAQILKQSTGSEHILIVIDSLHTWASWMPVDEYERLNQALQLLRMLASELECPVLYIAEQSKSANRENSKNKDMGSSATAGHRGVEYGAESVIGLRAECNQDGKPITDAYGRTPVAVTFHKNRNGAAGKPILMSFDGALQEFKEV